LYRSKVSWRPAIQGKGSKTLDQDKNKTGMLGTERTGTDSLKLPIHMPSLKKRKPKEQTPLDNQKAMGTGSLEQAKQS